METGSYIKIRSFSTGRLEINNNNSIKEIEDSKLSKEKSDTYFLKIIFKANKSNHSQQKKKVEISEKNRRLSAGLPKRFENRI